MYTTTHTYNLRDRETIKQEVKNHMYYLREGVKKDYTPFFNTQEDLCDIKCVPHTTVKKN